MEFCNKEEAVRRMNRLGASGQPFVFIIDYKQESIYIEEVCAVNPGELLYDLNDFTNVTPCSRPVSKTVEWAIEPVSFDSYSESFHKVIRNIRAGNSYLVNLTSETRVQTNLTLEDVFHDSVARYKLWLKGRFVVFSPEIFVRIAGQTIYSYPMKGTIKASLPDAEWQILNNAKEEAEHATIVDLIRNDLSQVATQVIVSRYRYIDELKTNRGGLLQVSSEISGRLPEDWKARVGYLLFRLLPAGSITGAPKQKTLEIIAEAETYERGFYTGVAGYFDGCNLDSAVMIRFLEQREDGFYFKSGGGITSQSDLVSEYNEMKQKVYVPIY